ncbi:hypothetical protein Acr_10g0010030 [Actinidia rufa]|uniref:Retrotransposon gag domain-containing protein n=1 Tax=Actinidia rufa TaxID=165716 RepID=A0A7J0FA91_9ERIC|nr:hypothetical protein Acr_10g0010030 [Actinidia rufa]
MQVPVRVADSRAIMAMKAFLKLCPPMCKGEPDLLVMEDWLEQVTRALDTILVTEEELRVLFTSFQLQGDAFQWWNTVEEGVTKKWKPFKKAFLDQYVTDMVNEALRMEFINLGQGSMTVDQYEAKFTSLSRFARAFILKEEEKAKQFMRGLRPSIRNKIARNLIKVYLTMISSATAIEETLNETRKIQNLNVRELATRHHVVDCPLKGQQWQSQQKGQPNSQAQGQSQVHVYAMTSTPRSSRTTG